MLMKPEVSAGCHQTLSRRWGLGTRLRGPDSHAGRVWSNSHHHLVSNTPRISWRVNLVSDEWRRAVAFFGMLFRERGVITEHLPLQNASQFMFTPTSLDALLLSM